MSGDTASSNASSEDPTHIHDPDSRGLESRLPELELGAPLCLHSIHHANYPIADTSITDAAQADVSYPTKPRAVEILRDVSVWRVEVRQSNRRLGQPQSDTKKDFMQKQIEELHLRTRTWPYRIAALISVGNLESHGRPAIRWNSDAASSNRREILSAENAQSMHDFDSLNARVSLGFTQPLTWRTALVVPQRT